MHSEDTSRSLNCTLSIRFTTERCCERCGKPYFNKRLYNGYPNLTPCSLGVLEGYYSSPVVYTSARSGNAILITKSLIIWNADDIVACLQTSLIFLGLTFSVQGSPPKHPSVLNGHPS